MLEILMKRINMNMKRINMNRKTKMLMKKPKIRNQKDIIITPMSNHHPQILKMKKKNSKN